MPAIVLDHVSKRYARKNKRTLLMKYILGMGSGRPAGVDESDVFYALRDVSLTINPSESVAIVGPNGAGKTTLLSLVAGLAMPDAGTVDVAGRVAALMELGSGFHPDLTGEENVRVNAALLGLTRKETAAAMGRIVEFAGAEEYIQRPMRTYSSGMIVRLAFATAVSVDPDVLIIDEVLAVGDKEFQARCFAKIREFRAQGKTMLVVSHAPGMLEGICDQAVLLNHGEFVMKGSLQEVQAAYSTQHAAASAAS
jgi:ABC-type polysaccharide/polyol phosphate transport system ATPase subunit